MPELIIDTMDKEEVAKNLLLEAGVAVEETDTINTFVVDDEVVTKVEEILAANEIEFQWSAPASFPALSGEGDDGDEDPDEDPDEDEDEDEEEDEE